MIVQARSLARSAASASRFASTYAVQTSRGAGRDGFVDADRGDLHEAVDARLVRRRDGLE